jgi:hypothetical protein
MKAFTTKLLTKRGLVSALAGLGLAFGVAGQAQALMTLTIDDSNTALITPDVTITDNGAGDLDLNAGYIAHFGSVGTWTFNISSGWINVGTELMHLHSATTSSTEGGSLTIRLSRTGYVSPGTTIHLAGGIGGITNGTVDYTAEVDNGDTLFGSTETIGSVTGISGGTFASNFARTVSVDGFYSITETVVITHTAAAGTSFDANVTASEPAILALLAMGLFLTGATHRRQS